MTKKEHYFLLIALCVLVYANSLPNLFVSDDVTGIVTNPNINNPQVIFRDFSALLNSLNYHIAKLNPVSYHITSVILHTANTLLVFAFLQLFFGLTASFLGACLFAVHPAHVEAVTWISGKPYLVTTLFMLTTFFLYRKATALWRAKRRINRGYYAASVGVFTWGLFANPTISIFLLFLVIYDLVYKERRCLWRWWLPYSCITLVWAFLIAQKHVANRVAFVAKELGGSNGWTNPLYNMCYSFFEHLRLLFWPAALTLYHEPPVTTIATLKVEIVVLSILLCLLPFLYRSTKKMFLALVLYTIFLAPTYSPIMVSWLVAERYLYFPSIAFCMLFAFAYEKIASRVMVKQSHWLLIIFGLIIAAFAARAVVRNEDWRTPARLWRSTVEVSPMSNRSHNNMGDVYAKEGNTAGAIAEFRRSIELKPGFADGHHNLASLLLSFGKTDEAVQHFNLAITYNPELFESLYNLGVISFNRGEYAKAQDFFQRALKVQPDSPDARLGMRMTLEKLGAK